MSLMLLGACASFQAHPEPVLDTRALVASANFNIPDVLQNFASPDPRERDGLDPEGYRNMVVGSLMLAADSRYMQFRRRLAAESRGSSLLLDVGIAGLASGASIAGESTANALAAGASALTGTRSAVSRDVYFDRTIPAMIGMMDAERTRLRTGIMTNLRRSADEYPLAVALSDVAAYEGAASLDGAIELLTREAGEQSEAAQRQYAASVQNYTGPPAAGVPPVRLRISQELRDLETAGNVARLREIAVALELSPAEDATAIQIRRLISEKLDEAETLDDTMEIARIVGVEEGED
ncbi:MAG TPA: hypothetical protein VF702_06575 [Allosphingosinicella sp.]